MQESRTTILSPAPGLILIQKTLTRCNPRETRANSIGSWHGRWFFAISARRSIMSRGSSTATSKMPHRFSSCLRPAVSFSSPSSTLKFLGAIPRAAGGHDYDQSLRSDVGLPRGHAHHRGLFSHHGDLRGCRLSIHRQHLSRGGPSHRSFSLYWSGYPGCPQCHWHQGKRYGFSRHGRRLHL